MAHPGDLSLDFCSKKDVKTGALTGCSVYRKTSIVNCVIHYKKPCSTRNFSILPSRSKLKSAKDIPFWFYSELMTLTINQYSRNNPVNHKPYSCRSSRLERFNTSHTDLKLDSGSNKRRVITISSMAASMHITAATRNGHVGPPRNSTYKVRPIEAAAILTPQVW